MSPETKDLELAKTLAGAREAVRRQLGAVIVGQDNTVEEVLIALFSRGHCLLQGVPGLAKTLLVTSLARILDLEGSRIQFTPDLMPSDVTGTEILQEDPVTRARTLRFVKGPVFANMVLADEINRTPPRTQAALLQAMAEGQVTAGGSTHALPKPFFVMATQNPIEQEGTYPLPEAQTDRFLFKLIVDYQSAAEESLMMEKWGQVTKQPALKAVSSGEELLGLRTQVDAIHVSPAVQAYILALVRSSRDLAA